MVYRVSQFKAQFLNQFNQIKTNIVKIKVNPIAQVLFAPTAASSLDLKNTVYSFFCFTGCLKIKAKKNLKKSVV